MPTSSQANLIPHAARQIIPHNSYLSERHNLHGLLQRYNFIGCKSCWLVGCVRVILNFQLPFTHLCTAMARKALHRGDGGLVRPSFGFPLSLLPLKWSFINTRQSISTLQVGNVDEKRRSHSPPFTLRLRRAHLPICPWSPPWAPSNSYIGGRQAMRNESMLRYGEDTKTKSTTCI